MNLTRFMHRALFVLLALFASLALAGKPVANTPPTVSITSPSSGATFTAPASIALTAAASDANGTVTQVAYYRGNTLIGTATGAPYAVTWPNVAAGSYSITAKATDNGGATATSTAVAITVTAGGGGGGGNVTIASPANGATVYTGSVTVTGTFVGSSTSSYVLVDNGASSRFATLTGNSYSATLPVNLGGNTVTVSVARADKTSDKVSITVNGSAPPLVVFTSPSGAATSAPANFTLGVDAVSPGSIASVSFARNGTLLGTVSNPPYSYNWQNVGAGTYAVTATAIDNNGQTGSAALSLQVGPPNLLPAVSITKPTAGQQFTAPGSIEIEVGANDADGSVSQVEFLQNGISLGASNVAPYKLTWPNVPQGSYALTARATDNAGGVANSPAVNVIVNPQPPIGMSPGLDGATFQAPASVALSASTGGPALGVSFYQVVNSTNVLIGDSPSTGSPYTYSWNVRTAGTYTVVARTLMMVSGFPTPFEFWSSPATFTVTANPAGDITYLHHDFAGSVIAATDANGAVMWKEDYKPYGERVMNDPAAAGNRQFFTGKPLDQDTGLSYMGARYYDPAVGRFMGMDPIGIKADNLNTFNRYVYANNNPYRYVDPDGRDAVAITKRDGSIQILVPITFSGSGATPAAVQQIKNDVSSRWSGVFNIEGRDTRVSTQVVDGASHGKLNTIALTEGPTSNRAAMGASFVRGGNSGEWNINSPGMRSGEAAHEAGHLMGEGDYYREAGVDSAGARRTETRPSHRGNLMGELGGTTNAENLRVILNSPRNVRINE